MRNKPNFIIPPTEERENDDLFLPLMAGFAGDSVHRWRPATGGFSN